MRMMRKNLLKILILFFCPFLLRPTSVLADGGIFPPPDFYVGQTEQKAVIFYDEKVETLILSITFQGNAKDFGWVVPTPTKPEVDKSSDELFLALRELTQRPIRYEKELMPLPLGEGVEVIETKEVGIYEISVLKADDPKALSSWLDAHGYNFPPKASYILEDYIKNKWYFTAVKVRPELVWEGVEEQLRSGHATPLKLVFKSEKIVYPLKITSVARYFSPPVLRPVSILLYVFAESEKDLPGFRTLYAERIDKEEIENLAYNDDGTPWIKVEHEFVLTKLQRTMQPVEMTDDLILRDKAGGLKIRLTPLPTKPPIFKPHFEDLIRTIPGKMLMFLIFFTLWLSSPIGWIFTIATLVAILARSKLIRAIAWFFQGFSLLMWFLVMGALLFASLGVLREEMLFLPSVFASLGLSAGLCLFVLMVAVLIWQIKHLQKKK